MPFSTHFLVFVFSSSSSQYLLLAMMILFCRVSGGSAGAGKTGSFHVGDSGGCAGSGSGS